MRSPGIKRQLALATLSGLLVLGGCRTPGSIVPDLDPEAVAAERETQREAFLRASDLRGARVQSIAFPLLQVATELFPGRSRPTIGITTMSANDVEPPYAETAIRIFDLSEIPLVRAVAQGSPAEEAGFQVGDRLIKVDGASLEGATISALETLRSALSVGEPVQVTVLRAGNEQELSVTPVALAPYRVQIAYSQAVNARATGGTIEINLGMIDFCENETELAFIIAHELAHNALRHHRDFLINYLLGTAADLALLAMRVPSANLIGLTALHRPSSAYETEADYVALYLLARAGHDLDALRGFWRRMALIAPERRASRHALWSHPEPAARQVLLEIAIDEIHHRMATGLPIAPPRKP